MPCVEQNSLYQIWPHFPPSDALSKLEPPCLVCFTMATCSCGGYTVYHPLIRNTPKLHTHTHTHRVSGRCKLNAKSLCRALRCAWLDLPRRTQVRTWKLPQNQTPHHILIGVMHGDSCGYVLWIFVRRRVLTNSATMANMTQSEGKCAQAFCYVHFDPARGCEPFSVCRVCVHGVSRMCLCIFH